MIVFTHADKVPGPKDFQRVFDGRTQSLNNVIADVTKGKSQGLPAVAITNRHKYTPDGADWLGELFTTSVERLDPERLAPFLLAFVDDLGTPKTQKPKTDAREDTTQKIEKRIQLTQEQVIRVEKKSVGASGILGVVAAVASIGTAINIATVRATLGLAPTAGKVIGGIVDFISWLRDR